MPCELPAGVMPGDICRHERFYRDRQGNWQRKYLLVLAGTPSGDVIYRLLTSRAHGRPTAPPCFHGLPYPGFYLGVLGSPLTADSWLDLHHADDYDGADFVADLAAGRLQRICGLPVTTLCPALDCVAAADDTTRQQEACIRDARAGLDCR